MYIWEYNNNDLNAEDHLFGLPIIKGELEFTHGEVLFGDFSMYMRGRSKIMDNRVFLKVKICSLMGESKIINRQFHKMNKRYIWNKDHEGLSTSEYHRLTISLDMHRRYEVRPEARASLIAYGYLRGKDYPSIEYKAKKPIPVERILSLVKKYGTILQLSKFEDWINAAVKYQESLS